MEQKCHVVVFMEPDVNITRCASHSARNDEVRVFDEWYDARAKTKSTRELPTGESFERGQRMLAAQRMLPKKADRVEQGHGKSRGWKKNMNVIAHAITNVNNRERIRDKTSRNTAYLEPAHARARGMLHSGVTFA